MHFLKGNTKRLKLNVNMLTALAGEVFLFPEMESKHCDTRGRIWGRWRCLWPLPERKIHWRPPERRQRTWAQPWPRRCGCCPPEAGTLRWTWDTHTQQKWSIYMTMHWHCIRRTIKSGWQHMMKTHSCSHRWCVGVCSHQKYDSSAGGSIRERTTGGVVSPNWQTILKYLIWYFTICLTFECGICECY